MFFMIVLLSLIQNAYAQPKEKEKVNSKTNHNIENKDFIIQNYMTLLEKNPNDIVIRNSLGLLLIESQEYEEALKQFEFLVNKVPTELKYRLSRWECIYKLKTDMEYYYWKSVIFYKREQYKYALMNFDRMKTPFAFNPDFSWYYGSAAYYAKLFDKVVTPFMYLVKDGKNIPSDRMLTVFQFLMESLDIIQSPKEGIEVYIQFNSRFPKFMKPLYDIYIANHYCSLTLLGKQYKETYSRGISIIDKLSQRTGSGYNATHIYLNYMKGVCYTLAGHYIQAAYTLSPYILPLPQKDSNNHGNPKDIQDDSIPFSSQSSVSTPFVFHYTPTSLEYITDDMLTVLYNNIHPQKCPLMDSLHVDVETAEGFKDVIGSYEYKRQVQTYYEQGPNVEPGEYLDHIVKEFWSNYQDFSESKYIYNNPYEEPRKSTIARFYVYIMAPSVSPLRLYILKDFIFIDQKKEKSQGESMECGVSYSITNTTLEIGGKNIDMEPHITRINTYRLEFSLMKDDQIYLRHIVNGFSIYRPFKCSNQQIYLTYMRRFVLAQTYNRYLGQHEQYKEIDESIRHSIHKKYPYTLFSPLSPVRETQLVLLERELWGLESYIEPLLGFKLFFDRMKLMNSIESFTYDYYLLRKEEELLKQKDPIKMLLSKKWN
ncbi:hypothetical protein WA158_000878 [Blastocystis sp. Blastoise]